MRGTCHGLQHVKSIKYTVARLAYCYNCMCRDVTRYRSLYRSIRIGKAFTSIQAKLISNRTINLKWANHWLDQRQHWRGRGHIICINMYCICLQLRVRLLKLRHTEWVCCKCSNKTETSILSWDTDYRSQIISPHVLYNHTFIARDVNNKQIVTF